GGNFYATQDERPAGHNAVDIPPLSHTQVAQEETRGASSSARNNRARSISDGFVILMLRSLPGITLTSTCSSRSTRLDSSVPAKPSSRALAKACLSKSKRNT